MDVFQEEINKLNGTDFFQLAKREPHSRVRIRLLALGHLQTGKTKTEVVNMFQIVFPTLLEWLLQFIQDGIEGLQDQRGKGRKRKLTLDQEEEFRRQIEELQKDRKGGRMCKFFSEKNSLFIMRCQVFITYLNDVVYLGYRLGRSIKKQTVYPKMY